MNDIFTTRMIYLDHNATTPVLPEVRDAMLPLLGENFGNPSSVHEAGRLARNALDEARRQVASLAGVHARNVIFTSGGTEANNLVVRGLALRALQGNRRGRILVGATEHSAMLEPAHALRKLGFDVIDLPVDALGRISPEILAEHLTDETLLVSVMAANNETGVIQDVSTLAKIAREAGATFHTDAVQLAGKLPLDFAACGAHLMTLSGHKIGGPKGIGALITDGSVDFLPQVIGGGQEGGLRAGTENLPGIVGFGVAAGNAAATQPELASHTAGLRAKLEEQLETMPQITVFARDADRLPNTCQFAVSGMDGETVQMGLDRQGIAVSTGSACHSRSTEPSHVLLAMGVDPDVARGAIRVSFGRENTEADVDALIAGLNSLAAALPTGAANSPGGGAVGW